MVKIQSSITDNGQQSSASHKTYYRRGALRRRETSSIVDIANCDIKSGFLIDPDAHEYTTYNVVRFWSPAQFDEYLRKNPSSAVHIESETVDTGERKTFFGYPAKHLVTTIKRAGNTHNSGGEEKIDGWYIEHERPDNHCAPAYTQSNFLYLLGTVLVTFPEVPEFRHVGPVADGLAVKRTRTVKFAPTKDRPSGRIVISQEAVEELSDAPLSPSLFALPSGLHENPQLLRGRSVSP